MPAQHVLPRSPTSLGITPKRHTYSIMISESELKHFFLAVLSANGFGRLKSIFSASLIQIGNRHFSKKNRLSCQQSWNVSHWSLSREQSNPTKFHSTSFTLTGKSSCSITGSWIGKRRQVIKECLPFLPGWLVVSLYLNIIGDKEWGGVSRIQQNLRSQTVTISESIVWR